MQKSLPRRILNLALCLFVIWAVLWKVTPILVNNIPALAHYGQVALENNIMPGALYYNDVPVTLESEQNNRDTVRFLPRGDGVVKTPSKWN